MDTEMDSANGTAQAVEISEATEARGDENSDVGLDSDGVKRHKRHYYNKIEGNCYLKVEDTTFCVPIASLATVSGIFKHILTLPPNENNEGLAEQSPLYLHGINLAEFESLMDFLFHVDHDIELPDLPLSYLFSLLKLADLWSIETVRKYAIGALSNRVDFNVCLKMQFAKKYDIVEWIDRAFRDLMAIDVESFTISDVEIMGIDIFLALTRAQNRITRQKHYVAYTNPPPQMADDCRHHDKCEMDWLATWQNGFCKYLLHPERPISPKSALLKLEEANFAYMSKDCHSNTIHYLKKTKKLDFIERIVGETIEELLGDQKRRRMNRVIGPRPPSGEGSMDVQIGENEL